MADEKPIIVLKKKGGHGGHHGGAWKVAYADFVTAMMCFFMVMWLVNSADTATRKNIAQYFKRPGVFDIGSGAPLLTGEGGIIEGGQPQSTKINREFTSGAGHAPLKKKNMGDPDGDEVAEVQSQGKNMVPGITKVIKGQGQSPSGGKSQESDVTGGQGGIEGGQEHALFIDEGGSSDTPAGAEEGVGSGQGTAAPSESPVMKQMQQTAQQIREQIAASQELKDLLGEVDVRVDADGLHIEIMDTEKTSMFALGSARVNPEAEQAFQKIGEILAKLPNQVNIVGHTDAKPFRGGFRGGYSNWELSADRANSARRLLEKAGIPPERIANVLGRADRELKNPSDPTAAANRRITLTVQFPRPASAVPADQAAAALQAAQTAAQGEAFSAPIKTPAPKVHSLTPQEILVRNEKRQKNGIRLPEEPPPTTNPAYMQKDKIFSDHPVFGPPSAALFPSP